MIHSHVDEPGEGHALGEEPALEVAAKPRVGVDGRGIPSGVERVGGESARGLADIPLDGMEPVAAVGDVRGAQVLGAGEEISHSHRDQRAHGDLEGPGAA